jgi:hypothetical protein
MGIVLVRYVIGCYSDTDDDVRGTQLANWIYAIRTMQQAHASHEWSRLLNRRPPSTQ